MILKKPYAFLIKYFKVIHLILLLLIVFITYKFNIIANFFSDYNKNAIIVTENMASSYVNGIILLATLIVVIFSILMFFLMKKKKKPYSFYIILGIYYLVIFISMLIASGIISSLFESTITQQVSRAYSDIYLILSLPAYYFIVMSLIRGIGFDIKKFNFGKDLEELEIKSEDNEEFEFVLGNDTYKYQRKLRRILRELKYYFLENKLVISIVGASIIVIVLIIVIVKTNFFGYKLSMAGGTTAGNYSIKINHSYITSKDYNGNLISSNHKYVIVDMSITNKGQASTIEKQNLYISYGNKTSFNKSSYGNYFIDLGKTYNMEVIGNNKTERYLFVFEIDGNYSSFSLNILNSVSYDENNQATYDYIKYKINPSKIDQNVNEEEKSINESMYLGTNAYGNSTLIIKSIEIMPSYEYQYQVCNGSDCKDYYNVETVSDPASQKLLVITYSLKLTDDALIKNSIKDVNTNKYVFDKLLKYKYSLNEKVYTYSVSTRINKDIPNTIFLDVASNVLSSSDFKILVNTRDNHYILSTIQS